MNRPVTIPQRIWRGRTRNELRDYLAKQVREAIGLCVARLRKDKESVDEPNLFRGVDKAIGEFIKADYGSDP